MGKTTSDKVLSVLGLFRDQPFSWTVEEAAERLELPVSTTYRYFRSLAKSELITAYTPGCYSLGPAIIEYDRQLRMHDPLLDASTQVMETLADDVGQATNVLMARLYDLRVMCVNYIQRGTLPFEFSYERGRRMPLERGSAGKAVLANLSPKIIREIVGTSELIEEEEKESYLKDLKKSRSQGYVITSGDISAGARGFSVPIFGAGERLEGSLTVVLTQGFEDFDFIIELLIRARKTIEANLAISVLGVSHPE